MLDKDLDDAFMVLIKIALMILRKRNKTRKRRWAVRPANKDRVQGGYFVKVFKTINIVDAEFFFNHTRMQPHLYKLLFSLVAESLQKPRRRISPNERLSLTILYLSHGASIPHLSLSYKLGKSTVRQIILETCEVIWHLLAPVYVSEPTVSQYCDIREDFGHLWNMPNCVGAIDGKHIAIKCPKQSGSMFHNYKKFFSIVLMAACDARYTFTTVSVGSYGSESDSGIFSVSEFGHSLLNGTFPLPNKKILPGTELSIPNYFVGDAAFPLHPNLMRPFPGANLDHRKRIFNYRLSRVRRCIENAFGILTARWRILLKTIEMSPTNCETIVLACIALHNFIMLNDQGRWYCGKSFVDWEDQDHVVHPGEWRSSDQQNLLRSIRTHVRRRRFDGFSTRDTLANYFISEGALPYQNQMIE